MEPAHTRRRRRSPLRKKLEKAGQIIAPLAAVLLLAMLAAGVVKTVENAAIPSSGGMTSDLSEGPTALVDGSVDASAIFEAHEDMILDQVFTSAGSPAISQAMLDLALAPSVQASD